MAPHGEAIGSACTQRSFSNDALHRTTSDISFQLSKEALKVVQEQNNNNKVKVLAPISEVEIAKCECYGMSEECTLEYIERARSKFMGKWVCGLCTEAVTEEEDIKKVSMEEALSIHMNACSRFNKLWRAYPVLFQAEAMRAMLKKSGRGFRAAKSFSPRDHNKAPLIARSSSCIPAITNINPSSNFPN